MKKIITIFAFLSLSLVVACGDANKAGSDKEPVYDVIPIGLAEPQEEGLLADGEDIVYFKTDRSDLSQEAQIALRAQADWLQRNPEYQVLAEGHADERGTRVYNLALGARRASAVRDYLVHQGISDARIRIVSFGKERPDSLCSAERCWAQNRRVLSVFLTSAQSEDVSALPN